MSNFRKIRGNFVTTSRQVAQDERLSWKARGIFLYLASMNDDWNFYVDEIAKHSPQGKRALQAGLKELEKYGYLIRVQQHKETGDFSTYDWELHFEPISRQTQNRVNAKMRQTQNEPLINNNNNNKQLTINNNSNNNDQASLTERFENLWKLYPKKQGKQAAFRAYKRAVKTGTTDKDIEQGIANYKKYIKVKRIDNQYIKQGSTWFNQGCWEDEYLLGSRPNQQNNRKYLF